MFRIAEAFVRWIAPVLSFTADEMWGYLPRRARRQRAVRHLVRRPGAAAGRCGRCRDRLRPTCWQVRDQVAKVLEPMRANGEIGAALEAEIELRAACPTRTGCRRWPTSCASC
jgi:isoleucyl-tRNA synthetase